MDWNWDLDWWRRPRRVVRPRPLPENAHRADEDHGADSAARDSRSASDEPPPIVAGNEGAAELDVSRPERSADERPTASRPFHALYLTGAEGDAVPADRPGTKYFALAHAPPDAVARILEWLYVPMGRSGSPAAPYLIYENVAEFEASYRASDDLDVAPLAMTTPAVTSGDALLVGIGMLMHLLQEGPAVDDAIIAACESKLAEAVQSSTLDPPTRWRAAILAARLAADYRYDYDAARSYCRQAERHSVPNSIEQMTARWWRADALVQSGRRQDGLKIYRGLVNRFGERWPTAAIVARSRSILAAK